MTARKESAVHRQSPHHGWPGRRASRSSDGRLDIKLSTPGSAGTGTNPEQLFAAGWSACFTVRWGLRPAR